MEPVDGGACLRPDDGCDPVGAKWSSFYGTWVRQESPEAGRRRYAQIAGRMAFVLKDSPDPVREAGELVGIAANESGFREDAEFGRGRSGRTRKTDPQFDDAGGQGRGPSNEVCLMQILPSMAESYGGAEKLLGESDDALDRCFRAALDQVRYARARCLEPKRREGHSLAWATAAYYGTGNSCTSPNGGKTGRRAHTIAWVTEVIRAELSK